MRTKDQGLMKKIESYIADYYLESGKTPSTSEIANAVGIVKSTAYKYLVAMDKCGLVHYENGVIDTGFMKKLRPDCQPVAAVGSIACGDPTLEEENLLYKTTLPTEIFGTGPFFLLKARGDSMEDAGIIEGDLLVIRKTQEPNKGDIIVALDAEGQNTLKEYGGIDPKTRKVILKYRNRAVYGDKVILVDELSCQGILSHAIKKF